MYTVETKNSIFVKTREKITNWPINQLRKHAINLTPESKFVCIDLVDILVKSRSF